MQRVSFMIPGEIKAWARAGKHGKVQFTPAPQRAYMNVIRFAAESAMKGQLLFDKPVALKVVAVYPWNKSAAAKLRQSIDGAWKGTRPDGDNILKIIKDSMNQIVYVDDALCALTSIWKIYGDKPGLHVSVTTLADVAAPVMGQAA